MSLLDAISFPTFLLADAATTVARILQRVFGGIGVSFFASKFARLFSRSAASAVNLSSVGFGSSLVFAASNGFKVVRVDARFITAQMIYFPTSGYWTLCPFMNNTVRHRSFTQQVGRPILAGYPPISILVFCALPKPAPRTFVYENFGEESSYDENVTVNDRQELDCRKQGKSERDLCYSFVSQGVNLLRLGLALVRPVRLLQQSCGSLCILAHI